MGDIPFTRLRLCFVATMTNGWIVEINIIDLDQKMGIL